MLKNIENERKAENTTKKTTLHWAPLTYFTFILISSNRFLSLYSFESLIKWKEPIYSFLGKKYVYQGLKLLKLECEYVADILILILRMNGFRKKYIRNEKNTRVGIPLFEIVKSQLLA